MKTLVTFLLVAASLLTLASEAKAATFTVGASTGCEYANVRDALNAAANNALGPHLVKIARVADASLAYSGGNPDSAFTVADPKADIIVDGGYESCSGSTRSTTGYTLLQYANSLVDVGYPMLTISNDYDKPRRTLTLRNVVLSGGSTATSAGPAFGGGIYVINHVTLRLEDATKVENFRAAQGGGGVALLGWYLFAPEPTPDQYPALVMTEDAQILSNSSSHNGGGVYALFADVILDGGKIKNNQAKWNGGGIWSSATANNGNHYEIEFKRTTYDYNGVSGNSAGQDSTFVDTRGFGGGIYSSNSDIHSTTNTNHGLSASIYQNTANTGGGMYVQGSNGPAGSPYTLVRLNDVLFSYNTARGQGGALYSLNAVDWRFDSTQTATSVFIDNKLGPTSAFWRNEAHSADVTIYGGGVAYIHNERSDGMSRGIMRFYRSWFIDNKDTLGDAAVVAADGASEMAFYRSIFDNNSGNPAFNQSAVLYSATDKDVRVTYSTAVDNTTDYFFKAATTADVNLNLQGSLLWSPVASGLTYMVGTGSIDVDTNACLIAVYNPTPTNWDLQPVLDNHYAPGGGSAALDYCDSFGFQPISDIKHHGVYDTLGVVGRFSATGVAPTNWDLGAVEQTDIIYVNGFGPLPTN